MTKRSFIIVLLCATLALPAAWAQTRGRIEGRVLDSAGQPLPKAAVSVVSQKTTTVHYELTADAQGRFFQVTSRISASINS